jgi:hypothetical protein
MEAHAAPMMEQQYEEMGGTEDSDTVRRMNRCNPDERQVIMSWHVLCVVVKFCIQISFVLILDELFCILVPCMLTM